MDAFYQDLYKFLHAITPFPDSKFPEIPTVELDGPDANTRGPVYLREFDAESCRISFEAASDSIRCGVKFKRSDAIRNRFLRKLARSAEISFLRRAPLPEDDVTLLFIPSSNPSLLYRQAREFFESCVDTDDVSLALKQSLAIRE